MNVSHRSVFRRATRKIRLLSILLTGCCLGGTLPAVSAFAASAPTIEHPELLAFLHEPYYAVEVFVFERPGVMDYATDEILNLNRPRALPRAIRTQRLDPQSLWTDAIDPLTRACLTFPILTYELLPAMEAADEYAHPAAADVTIAPEEDRNPMPDATLPPAGASRPVPEISPQLAPDPMLDFLAAMAAYERSLQAASQRWQAQEDFQLRREAARVERTGYGRILFHGRWQQAVPPRETSDPILITGGARLHWPAEIEELVGSIGVTLGRYLHFNAELFFHAPGLGLNPVAAALDPTGRPVMATRPDAAPGYMVLSESRRMRSGELHYLDHPKLGLVVRIDPIPFPDELVQAYESLEERTE